MLGNMQNKFDSIFGDVTLSSSTRFQLIEFKQVAGGFVSEVLGGKSHRGALYEHLLEDTDCRQLSYRGHLGGYVSKDIIRVDPYFALGAAKSKSDLKGDAPPNCFHDFDSYYDSWHTSNEHGEMLVGLDAAEFVAYMQCMYKHLRPEEKGLILTYDLYQKKIFPYRGSIRDFIDELLNAFLKLANLKTSDYEAVVDALRIKSYRDVIAFLDSLKVATPSPKAGKGGKGPKGGSD
jgi:hypothetical protein